MTFAFVAPRAEWAHDAMAMEHGNPWSANSGPYAAEAIHDHAHCVRVRDAMAMEHGNPWSANSGPYAAEAIHDHAHCLRRAML
jgi:hypothetical protein